ncbi:MAG: PAS domain S-box protein [Candidatus Marinimicrobia bacterium]|nr:PAS domain S-box protein [Candidatus Neomarinimicrobiota bacterium]
MQDTKKYANLFEKAAYPASLSRMPDGVLVDVNEAFEQTFGYSRGEALGKTTRELGINPDAETRKRILKSLQETGAVHREEMPLRTRSGDERVFLVNMDILDIDGEQFILNTTQDITDQKRAQESLEESEARYRNLIDVAPTGIAVHCDGKVVFVNPAGARILGAQSPEDLVGKPISAIIHPDGLAQARQRIQRMLSGKQGLYPVEDVYIKMDGTPLHVEVVATVLTYRGKPAVQVVVTDITERREAQKKIRASEEQYHAFFEHSMDAILLTAPDGTILEANPAACAMFERTEEEIIRAGRAGLVDSSDPRLAEMLEERKKTGKTSGELTMFRRDGTPFPVEITSAVFEDSDGKMRTSMILRDISDKKRANEALTASEERLRLSTELANVAVWEYDFRINEMSRSDNHDELYGLDWQDVWRIDTFLNATHPDDRELSNRKIQEAVAPGGPDRYQFDFRIIYPDESIHWLVVVGEVVERNAQGEGIIVRGSLVDITNRKLTEQELRANEQKYRDLFHSIQDAILVADTKREIIDCNMAFTHLFGYTLEEVKGKQTAYVYANSEDYQRMGTQLADHMEDPEFTLVVEFRKKSGETFRGETATNYLQEPNGKVIGFIGLIRDVTAREKRLRELAESRQELRALAAHLQSVREEERQALARDLHDDTGQVFTALNMDLSFLEQSLENAKLPATETAMVLDEIHSMTHTIDGAMHRLRQILMNLRPTVLENLGLGAALEQLTEHYQTEVALQVLYDNRINRVTLGSENDLAVYRIVQEALTNVVRHAKASQVSITVQEEGNELHVSIQDDGIGISESEIPSKNHFGVIGMRERAKVAGGDMTMARNDESGTTVSVRIPLGS